MDFKSLLSPFQNVYNFIGDTAKNVEERTENAANNLRRSELEDAPHLAILHIDQQMDAINSTKIYEEFEGATEMVNAVSIIKKAASPWPQIKASIITAAQEIVRQESTIKSLGNSENSVALLQVTLTTYATGTLTQLKNNFAVAKSGFDTFEQNLDAAYRESVHANAKAEVAINREKVSFKKSKERLNNLIHAAMGSPSSSSLFSIDSLVGSVPGVNLLLIPKLKRELEEVVGREEELLGFERVYKAALTSYSNILSATKITSYALLSLDTTIQQSLNSLNDMSALTNTNLIVMKAELKQFKIEFAGAVQNARHLH